MQPDNPLNPAIISTDTVLSSSYSRSQHNANLALKNFCPNVPLGFLNRPIMYTCVPSCVFGANAKKLSKCGASFPLIIFNACIIPPAPNVVSSLLFNLSSQFILGGPYLRRYLEDLLINAQFHF